MCKPLPSPPPPQSMTIPLPPPSISHAQFSPLPPHTPRTPPLPPHTPRTRYLVISLAKEQVEDSRKSKNISCCTSLFFSRKFLT